MRLKWRYKGIAGGTKGSTKALSSSWVRDDPAFLKTQLVAPEGRPDGTSLERLSDPPRPEEEVAEGVYAGSVDVPDRFSDGRGPSRIIHPLFAISDARVTIKGTFVPGAFSDGVDIQATVIDSVAPFSCARQTELAHRGADQASPLVACPLGVGFWWGSVDGAKDEVRVDVEREAIRARKEASPLVGPKEAVMDAHVGTVSSAIAVSGLPQHPVGLGIKFLKGLEGDGAAARFVEDTEEGNDGLDFGLGNELGENADVVHSALSVSYAHDAVEHVGLPKFARVVPSVLASWGGMKVEVDPKSVLAGPLDSFEEVLPAHALEEGFTGIRLDGPETDGDTDPVEAGSGDLSEIFLGDEGPVVLFEGIEIPIAGAKLFTEGPFVNGVWEKGLVHGGGNERFEIEPATKVNPEREAWSDPFFVEGDEMHVPIHPLFAPRPFLGQRRSIALSSGRVVERVDGIVDPIATK